MSSSEVSGASPDPVLEALGEALCRNKGVAACCRGSGGMCASEWPGTIRRAQEVRRELYRLGYMIQPEG